MFEKIWSQIYLVKARAEKSGKIRIDVGMFDIVAINIISNILPGLQIT